MKLGLRILERFGFSEDRIIKSKIVDFTGQDPRPKHLSFELAPLSGKLKTKPASISDQIDELFLPADLFTWFRENVDDQIGMFTPILEQIQHELCNLSNPYREWH